MAGRKTCGSGAVPEGFRAAPPVRGRGTGSNPQGRFERLQRDAEDDGWTGADAAVPAPGTTVTGERARSIVTRNRSPDLPFSQSVNAYRGCEHGCIYCYARATHPYLGLSAGLDFERRLFAKDNAAELLREELSRPGYRCQPIALGTNTDPYQPVERHRRITRALLEVLDGCSHPCMIVTKSALVERDLDVLSRMAARRLVKVFVSVTTLDRTLARCMEPRAAAPQRRLATLAALAAAGIRTGVLVAPVIPGLNDAEIERILESARKAGCHEAGFGLLRLPHEVRGLFEEWLAAHYPLRSGHVLSLLRQARAGREDDARFDTRMRGEGVLAALLERRFEAACRRLNLSTRDADLDAGSFRPPQTGQLPLWQDGC
ncbi:MAG: PA0069 family radical SAM protein [Pseudomonadota bacterium]|nr:PA0069 family radical SAM protein [Pseudomonadota bacterium]